MPAITLAWLAARVNHCIQPTSNADEAAERRAGVEIGAAGAIEAAADFREAQRHGERGEPHQHEADRAPGADLRRDLRRHQEDRAADHLVDADRGEVPAPERAPQRACRRSCIMTLG